MTPENQSRKVFTKAYQVRPNEADPRNFMKTVAALDYLQDMAWSHASHLGVSVTQLLEAGMTWVLSRFHFEQLRPVRQGETLTLKTWPFGIQRLYAIREFEGHDERGLPVVRATSGWLLLELPALRPLRPQAYLESIQVHPQRVLEDDFSSFPKMRGDDAELETPFHVRWHDLDINQHVNNTVYPRWAIEAMPPALLQSSWCRRMQIHFRGMVKAGDRVSVTSSQPDPSQLHFLHSIRETTSDKACTFLVSDWSLYPDPT